MAFVVGEYPEKEKRRRENAALAFSSADVEVGIVQVPATPYLHGLTPAEIQLVAPAFIEAFRRAESLGYDAVVPLGTLDLGVDGGRSAVDIPVIGPTEAMLHVASVLGDRFGGIVYHEDLLPMLQAIVRRYGMEHKMAGWRCSGFDLPDISNNRAAMAENFVAQARSLVRDDQCDVILALGITQCPVMMDPVELSKEIGVPVVEGIGAPIRLAGLLAGLGLSHSRRRWRRSLSRAQPAAPPDDSHR
ncbi:aspartate/glutamate racemase family protein (plasmid) [Roseomonas sp. OT10]|uniref:aspartate/glutamate racemase family protein n=1 Tax=Roseomonas cutis TaxID=2897332 RepID=UPI001E307EF3|nr:aspartate/glutamate racemase family protein [Roseomonas sp. OT10]UFN51538.1 aspartate/glutamate racemase family protein [Roseomonas sp. OT10]